MERKEIISKSRKIAEYLCSIDDFKKSKVVALYSPVKNEVETEFIFEYAKKSGKQILYPRVEDNSIVFSQVNDLQELMPGKFGIPEPPRTARSVSPENIEFFIIPGVAFDTNGFRLGYGYGYYDSVICKVTGVLTGLAYEFQVVDNIFPEDRDLRVNMIITEKGVINCSILYMKLKGGQT